MLCLSHEVPGSPFTFISLQPERASGKLRGNEGVERYMRREDGDEYSHLNLPPAWDEKKFVFYSQRSHDLC